MFSILIPTWNNLDYLRLCVESIRRHTTLAHEILVHVNDGSDGTLRWVREQGLRHTHSPGNVGICLAINRLAGLAAQDWLVYLNDDMVCCPGWDAALQRAIARRGAAPAYLSATVIEPMHTTNALTLVRDFGRSVEDFDAASLIEHHAEPVRPDRAGVASPVSVVRREWWHAVGGYSLEFSPGMGSEDDLMMKFWVAGCRDFALVGDSRVYHFACRSTGRVRRNHGARTFIMKWGLSQGEFRRDYLQACSQGMRAQAFDARSVPRASRVGRLKRAVYGLGGDFPLGDIRAWEPDPRRLAGTAGADDDGRDAA